MGHLAVGGSVPQARLWTAHMRAAQVVAAWVVSLYVHLVVLLQSSGEPDELALCPPPPTHPPALLTSVFPLTVFVCPMFSAAIFQ